ncbi:MAG TPA: hypothetical protein VGC05_16295 [Mycobacterium sp.]
MQNWVNVSRLARMAAGAVERAISGGTPEVTSEPGNGDQTDTGDTRGHVGGRSRGIHAFWLDS